MIADQREWEGENLDKLDFHFDDSDDSFFSLSSSSSSSSSYFFFKSTTEEPQLLQHSHRLYHIYYIPSFDPGSGYDNRDDIIPESGAPTYSIQNDLNTNVN